MSKVFKPMNLMAILYGKHTPDISLIAVAGANLFRLHRYRIVAYPIAVVECLLTLILA